MKLRVRGPNGVSTIEIAEDAMICELQSTIAEKTSLPSFDLKFGYPPQPLDLRSFDPTIRLSETGLKLNGEQLIAIAREAEGSPKQSLKNTAPAQPDVARVREAASSRSGSLSPSHASAKPRSQKPLGLKRKSNRTEKDPPELPVPSHQATMVLRVMPDDNSCLFRALGTAVLGSSLDSMTELRSLVASGIQSDPETYSEAVLQQKPDDYCRWIQHSDSWGGAIEIGILAQNFNVEVCSINVQDLRVDRFNEDLAMQRKRIILVYSGIHYDTIAMSPSEPPHTKADLPADLDIYQFDPAEDGVLEKARELCKVLQERHYFTDTSGFAIKCNTCGWTGKGEKAATAHAAASAHTDFGEADD